MMNNAVIPQGGPSNIFAELGFAPQEAENLKIRAELMLSLRRLIQGREWSCGQAAEYLGESVVVIESLLRGEIEAFTIEQLIMMLTCGGMQVRVEVSPMAA
jgi:predicted XRE-type DNA-binding protein